MSATLSKVISEKYKELRKSFETHSLLESTNNALNLTHEEILEIEYRLKELIDLINDYTDAVRQEYHSH